jgi:GT2 family glycosyltransferase
MMVHDVVVVVIGRNEGLRLERCLSSLNRSYPGVDIVYVDSGSTDASVEFAASLAIPLVRLDAAKPFTAARARNAGFKYTRLNFPDAKYLQFLDGDCELAETWLTEALETMVRMPRTAVLRGRIRERDPGASIYNRLCEMEWDGPVGEVENCGGITLMRVEAFAEVGGFQENLIAGEEPELCLRMRTYGWSVLRIAADMAVHDAHITSFGQWWRRSQRSGYANAQGIWLHGATRERYCVRESISAAFWGLIVPAMFLACARTAAPVALLMLLLYLFQTTRIALRHGWTYAVFCMLSKTAEVGGYLRFFTSKFLDHPVRLIEYK